MKSKGVTTHMKALNEYFLLVVFTLFLNRLFVFAIFMFNLDKKHGRERVKSFSKVNNRKQLYSLTVKVSQ